MDDRPVQPKRPRLVRVLNEDPDLAHRLDEHEAQAAARQTVGILEQIQPGPWRPAPVAQGKCLFGGLVLDGLLVRELTLAGSVSAELLGAGDLVLPEDADRTVPFVEMRVAWTALEPTRVAWLDAPFAAAMRRWPELGAGLLERTERRFSRLAALQAIGQLTRVDDRVLTLLWHLAERWGRVRTDGIVVPLRLTHKAIARLVGARRPSVTTAIGLLERRGLVERRVDGSWLLLGNPPQSLSRFPAGASPWRDGRTTQQAASSGGMARAALRSPRHPNPATRS
ncbi:MAG TPA: Crp/Fnr family transcriptional regulator [Solirubrobacteraceae bacterium]|jgi:CRP-like cAMP-binding protein